MRINFLQLGIQRLLLGLRTGRQGLVYSGAVITAWTLLRRTGQKPRTPVRTIRLRHGDSVTIRNVAPEDTETR